MTYGTSPHKLHRTDAPSTSIDAAYSVDTTHLERLVYECIRRAGAHGLIQDEVLLEFPGYPYSSITARFAALAEKKLIERPGDKRKGRSGRGQMVMRAVEKQGELL